MFARNISLPYRVASSAPCSMILKMKLWKIGDNFSKFWSLALMSITAWSCCWSLRKSVVLFRATERWRKCRGTELWNNLSKVASYFSNESNHCYQRKMSICFHEKKLRTLCNWKKSKLPSCISFLNTYLEKNLFFFLIFCGWNLHPATLQYLRYVRSMERFSILLLKLASKLLDITFKYLSYLKP